MEVLVNHLGAMQFDVKARRHSVVCDQPMEDGGFDEGMTPPEFLLAIRDRALRFMPLSICERRGLQRRGRQ